MQVTPPTSSDESQYVVPAGQTAAVPLRGVLIVASLGAAAIHFAAAPAHLSTNTVQGLFFLVAAWFAVAWALGLLLRRPTRAWLVTGAAVNLGIIAVWVVSHTIGIGGEVQAVAFPDAMATVLEGIVVLGSIAYVATPAPRLKVGNLTTGAFVGAVAIAVIALVSASMLPALGGGQTHGHVATGSASNVAAGSTAHDPTSTAAPVPYDPAKPIDLGGTPGVTPEQQAKAENLIAATLWKLPQWSDPAVAMAAGFHSIGDGATGVEHFVNEKFMSDGVMLDPDRPEALVYDTTGGGRKLAAAMYMAKPGMSLAQVPDYGGALMQWHVHTNLCYNSQGRVAGLTNAKGDCPAGLVKPPEIPMIHVWITPNKCGPFAALEGIGAGNVKQGETRLCDTAHGSAAH